ncbi:MAG: HAD-IIA family hydrolase [Ktedonobacterales bacterium]|nr:HAD-IIA family hydrolase [Ktedonobacterales bacterium]
MDDYQTYLLDLDGVVYRGDRLLPGARELVAWLDATGRQVVYLSNNSLAAPEEVAAKLTRLGMPHPEGRVLTAGWAAVQAVARRFPGGRVFVLALPAIADLAQRAGLRPVAMDEPEMPTPDAVVVGLDRSLTYARLRRAMRAILAGAAFIAVNRDPRLPVEDGFEPGTGALVAALEWSTGRDAEMIGKPAPGIVTQAMRQVGARPDQVLLVGDGLDLDMPAGHAAGVTTALVLTGLASAEQALAATGERKPDLVFADLPALLTAARARAERGGGAAGGA